ncbi:MAG: hypothetical protein LBR24_01050 [Methanobrevibacter sp.]|jgi:hypothetical protein|nr:hypothetical protein [Methanobrevibacter sp.]
MKTDAVLKLDVMKVLIEKFGTFEAERFINIVKTEKFDYTEWQRDLWKDKTVDEIYEMGVEFQKKLKEKR